MSVMSANHLFISLLSKWKGKRFSCLNFPRDFRGGFRKEAEPLETRGESGIKRSRRVELVAGRVFYSVFVPLSLSLPLLKSFNFKAKVTCTYL